MRAESDLAALLRGLRPGHWACTQVDDGLPAGVHPVVTVREDEGLAVPSTEVGCAVGG